MEGQAAPFALSYRPSALLKLSFVLQCISTPDIKSYILVKISLKLDQNKKGIIF